MKRAFAVVVAVLLLLSSGPATLAEAGVGFAPAALRGTGPNSIREVYCDGLFRAYARDKRAVGRELRNGPIKGWFVYDEVANLSGKRGVEQGKFSELAIAMRVGWLVRVPYATRGASNILRNKAAGDAFRDKVADALKTAGREVEKEVVKNTPFGRRVIDIEVSQGGKVLGGVETKVGGSRYLPSQRAKDEYLRRQGYPVNVVRDQ